MADRRLPPGTWAPVHAAMQHLLSPIQRFLEIEAASGLALIGATVAALAWANSPWAESYHALWGTELALSLGSWTFARPLAFWVNDGLMTIFFFVVGLEVHREIHEGALSGIRRAALPLTAALGGMVVPAAIYAVCNTGHDGAAGWGVPIATDIAFAVGVLALLGRRVAPPVRVLLLAVAVVDDIGAILVIAVFYSTGISVAGLALAAVGVAAIALGKASGIRAPAAYAAPALVVWIGMYVSGVHPTLAGVALGLLTPVRAWSPEPDALAPSSPASELEHALHRWVAFGIMPLFGFANAGVELGGASLSGEGLLVFVGIVAGLVAGKPIGILLACWLGVRARLALLPLGVSNAGLAITGVVAGIGFTMSLFIAQLALPAGPLLETAKLAILVGSTVSAVAGLVSGALVLRPTAAAGAEPAADDR